MDVQGLFLGVLYLNMLILAPIEWCRWCRWVTEIGVDSSVARRGHVLHVPVLVPYAGFGSHTHVPMSNSGVFLPFWGVLAHSRSGV